jgi:glycosyltransferase involved in cell wall biosynthesis
MVVLIEPAPYAIRLLEEMQAQWNGPVHGWFVGASITQDWSLDGDKSNYGILPASRGKAFCAMWSEIRRTQPSIVFVAGWSHPLIVAVILIARLSGARVVSMSDTWTSKSYGARALSKRLILKLIHAFTPGGVRQANYLRAQGVPPKRIFPACMTSDTRALRNFMISEGSERRAVLRAEMGLSDTETVFIFVGRLEPVKGLDLLIEAFCSVTNAPTARLLVVGDGTMRDIAVAAAENDPRILYRGRLEGSALWAEFAAADVLVLPSRSEPWGLVVNEAMSAGLAIVLHDCCGCIDDLVIDGETGVVVPTGNAVALRAAIGALSDGQIRVAEMRRAAARHVGGWTTEAWAANILLAWKNILNDTKVERHTKS